MIRQRFLRRALYNLERLWVRGPLVQILILLSFLMVISLTGGLVMVVFHPAYRSYPQASWWAFLHLTDTGYLGDDKDPLERIVAVILTFTGALLFVGGVIAILTTSLDRLMTLVSSGRTAVVEEGHLLLLGSNPGLSDLIAECASAAAQLWPSGILPSIVVLSESPVEVSLPCLPGRRLRVITRTGSASEQSSLERADFTRARVILVLASRARRGAGPSDLHVLKTLVALRAYLPKDGPRVVLDLSHPPNARLIPSLAGSVQTDVLSSLEFSGRLLCQCLRHPGISQAHRQLLSDAVGQSILVCPCPPNGVGQTLGKMRQVVTGAIVLGILSQGQTSLLDWNQMLLSGDELVVLAPSLEKIRFNGVPPLVEPTFGSHRHGQPARSVSVLIVGWNEGILSLVRELAHYRQEQFQLTVMASLEEEQVTSLRSVCGENTRLQMVTANLRQSEDLARIPDSEFDRVLLLAGQHQEPAMADAETALRYALLLERDSRFVVELHEESNAPLFGQKHDVVTTDQVINHMLAQIALKPAFRSLYEELFTYGGCELVLLRLEELLSSQDLPPQYSWKQLSEALFDKGWLALGIEQHDFLLNPPDQQNFAYSALVRVLVLAVLP